VLRLLTRLIADDSGQDLVEYALLAGLIGCVGALVFPEILEDMGEAYESWVSGAYGIWVPPEP
jgi:Flp pilus assembly pilin Flp